MGTLTAAICAKFFKKPVYVATESFKFIRIYPLQQVNCNQNDIPLMNAKENIVDYTPPNYITLLFTDFGIFTPSAVRDELIQFYGN